MVLITGASSGIGRAAAELWAARGARLVLCARGASRLEAVARVCREAGAEVVARAVDVTDDEQVQAAVNDAVQHFGRLDVAVSVAGVTAYGAHTDTPAAVFDQVVAVNLLGAANLARSALVVFRAQRHGSLVVVGSLLGRVAVPGMGAYVAAKWGLRGLVRTLQQEQRDLPHVHVSSVAPGAVRTAIYDRAGSVGGAGGTPPPPSTSPRRVARRILAAASSPVRETDVDALGGLLNKAVAAGFDQLPALFDRVAGPLLEQRRPDAVAPAQDGAGNVFTAHPDDAPPDTA